ncbi:MAG: alpha/beta fold hydrolase [Pseudomonadota bacterium]
MKFSFLEKSRFWILTATLVALGAVWFGAPGTVYRMFIATERQLAGLTPVAQTIGDERWVFLRSDPVEEPRPVLLLLHVFGADKDNFNRLARHLKDTAELVVPDLPGFGMSSSALDNRYTATAQAERVLAFMDQQGHQQFHVGGNSMGGYIALAMARLAPERIQSLWLLAPGGVITPPLSPFVQAIVDGEPNVLIPASEADFEYMLDFVFEVKPFLPGPVRSYLAENTVARQSRMETIFEGLKLSAPAETLAEGLAQPTLIVWGEQDRVLDPSGAVTLSRLLPQSRVNYLSGVGHLPQLEAPRQVADDYRQWLAATLR